ncbi:MAG: hypothetical protein PVSMB4_19120 [Ktedonobacterales bacterium]
MHSLRVLAVLSWIALPTVMYGGYALLGLLTRGNRLSAFQEQYFRAGHAHAGVLLLMSLLYYSFLEQTTLSPAIKVGLSAVLFAGILAQSGGFFLHMGVGKPGQASAGTIITIAGTGLIAAAVLVLVYGLIAM